MRATPQQLEAIGARDRSLVVEAGAGTGKTWVLVQRFVGLLEDNPGWPLESIVAVTFTEKAAREMRNRVRQEIEARAQASPPSSPWHERRRSLERLMVSTVHGLCTRILRENAISAGVDPRFTVLDEKDADLLKQDAIARTVEALVAEDAPCLRLLDDLTVSDVEAELTTLLARRGTVQRLFERLPPTEPLMERWRAGVVAMREGIWQDQRRVLPLLAASLAGLPAVEVADGGDKLAPAVAAAQEGVAAVARRDYAAAMPPLLAIKLTGGREAAWGGKEALRELRSWLGAVRDGAKALAACRCAEDVGPDDERAAAALQLWRDLWAALDATYTRLKTEQQVLDFDDLEMRAEQLLSRGGPDERLAAFRAGINHLMVDEFQDTNEAQRNIIYALAHPSDAGRLFVVGDAKQSIYRFRQAQVSVFNRTARDVQAITGHAPVPLAASFRTHSALAAAQNDAFAAILAPMGDDYCDYEARPGALTAERTRGGGAASADLLLLPQKDADGEKLSTESTRLFEAQQLADCLLGLYNSGYRVWDRHTGEERPFRYSDAAVLFRATTQMPLYEEQFQAAGLPYLTVAGRGYYDRPEVTDLIALLACLHNPADDLSLAVVLRSPLFSLNDETLMQLRGRANLTPTPLRVGEGRGGEVPTPLRQALAEPPATGQPERVAFAAATLAELWALAGRATVWELLRLALDRTGYEAALTLADAAERGGGRQRSNLHKFLGLAADRGAVGLSRFLRLVGNLRQREAREGEAMAAPPEAGAVLLMSVHAAKGLEFPVVAVADLGRGSRGGDRRNHLLHDPEFGIVCKQRDDDGDWQEPMGYVWAKWLHERMERAESKRLLYVACTRAADLLLLSGRPGNKDSWLEALNGAWGIEAEGAEDEEIGFDTYRIRVRRPAYAAADRRPEAAEPPSMAPVTDMPPLAAALPAMPVPRAVAVTRLQRLLAGDEDLAPQLRPPVRTGGESRGVPGYVLGKMVHAVLAEWECLALPDGRLRTRLQQAARREGLTGEPLEDAIRRSHEVVAQLRHSSVYAEVNAAAERRTEVPFVLEVGQTSLRGAIDLLYRDRAGTWHVLDWKTEWLKKGAPIAADPHLMQVAVYAHAAAEAIGSAPAAEVCFLQPDCHLHRYSPDEIAAEWERLAALLTD